MCKHLRNCTVFGQTLSNVIMLNDSMPADCLVKVVDKANENLYHKMVSEPKDVAKPSCANTLSDRSSARKDTTTFTPVIWNEKLQQELKTQHAFLCDRVLGNPWP